MYAVIFRAELKELDEEYYQTAEKLKMLAINKYGCSDFISVTEGTQEISISYWNNMELIRKWKNDVQHLAAQSLGRKNWYQSYQVKIVEVIREYNEAHTAVRS